MEDEVDNSTSTASSSSTTTTPCSSFNEQTSSILSTATAPSLSSPSSSSLLLLIDNNSNSSSSSGGSSVDMIDVDSTTPTVTTTTRTTEAPEEEEEVEEEEEEEVEPEDSIIPIAEQKEDENESEEHVQTTAVVSNSELVSTRESFSELESTTVTSTEAEEAATTTTTEIISTTTTIEAQEEEEEEVVVTTEENILLEQKGNNVDSIHVEDEESNENRVDEDSCMASNSTEEQNSVSNPHDNIVEQVLEQVEEEELVVVQNEEEEEDVENEVELVELVDVEDEDDMENSSSDDSPRTTITTTDVATPATASISAVEACDEDEDYMSVYDSFYIFQDNKERLNREKTFEQEIHKRKAATNPYLKSAVHVYKEPFHILKKFDPRYTCIPYKGSIFSKSQGTNQLTLLLRRPSNMLSPIRSPVQDEQDELYDLYDDNTSTDSSGVNLALNSLLSMEAASVVVTQGILGEFGADRDSFASPFSPFGNTSPLTPSSPTALSPLDLASATTPVSPRNMEHSASSNKLKSSSSGSRTLLEKLNKISEEKKPARSADPIENIKRGGRKTSRTKSIFANKKTTSISIPTTFVADSADAASKSDERRHEQKQILEKVKALCNDKTSEQLDTIMRRAIITRDEEYDTDFKSTRRLLSAFNTNYRWVPLEETKCYRYPNVYYPIRKKTKFVIDARSLKFDYGIPEPLFCRIALYDIHHRDKISEDFHFQLNTQDNLALFSDEVKRELAAATTKCLMSVTYPNSEIYLVMYIDKVLTGPFEDVVKPYLKELSDKDKKKLIESNIKNIEVLERFRQPFLWGITPLFESRGDSDVAQDVVLKRDLIEIKSFYKMEGDAKNIFNIYESISTVKSGKTKTCVSGCAQFNLTVITLAHAKMYHHARHSASVSSIDVPDVAITSLSPRPRDDTYTDDVNTRTEFDGYGAGNSSFQDRSSLSHGQVFSPSPDSYTEFTLGSVSALQRGRKSNASEDADASELTEIESDSPYSIPIVEELPTAQSRYPHTSVKNIVYVRPVAAQLALGKAKNIAVQVLLKDEDSSADNLVGKPYICGKYGNKMVDYALLGVSYGEKSPQFFDELKIELPVPFHPKHHLLFIFYEVQVEKKANKVKQAKGGDTDQERFGKASKVVIGYSFLPLVTLENQNDGTVPYLIDSDEYKINIYKSLSSLYLTNDKLENHGSKVKFRVEIKTKSTIYPADDVVKKIFYYTSQVQQTYENKKENIDSLILALNEVRHCRYGALLPHLPVLFDILFDIICTAYPVANDLLLAQQIERSVFDALMTILRHVYLFTETNRDRHTPTTQDTRLNRFISSFVTHIFENNEEHLPTYTCLIRILAEGIVRHQDSTTSNDPLESPLPMHNKQMDKYKKSRFATIRKKSFKEVTPDTTKAFSERDIVRFNWFFFDIIIKSLVLHNQQLSNRDVTDNDNDEDVEDHNHSQAFTQPPKQRKLGELGCTSADENPNTEGTYAHFFTHAKAVVRDMVKSIIRVVNSANEQHNYIGLAGNRNLALFICDLIPILSRQQVFDLVSEYNNNLQGMDPKVIELKMEFFAILFDNENILALNDPDAPFGNKLIEMFVDTFFILSQVASVDKSGLLLDRGCRIIMQFFTKLDHDARLQSKRARQALSCMLLPFVEKMFSSKSHLTMIKNDGELTAIVITFLWLLRNMDENALVKWWKEQDIFTLMNVVTFLETATATFFACQSGGKTSDSTRQGLAAINHIIALITKKEALDEILDKLSKLDPYMSQSFGTNIPANQQQMVQQQIELEEEFESTNTSQSPYVALVLRKISRLMMNVTFFSCLHDDRELVFVFFHNCLRPFLKNYSQEIVVKELYKKKKKKSKINAVEKSRIEQKWRWLMGCILANTELELVSDVNPIISDCYNALVEPFMDPSLLQEEQEVPQQLVVESTPVDEQLVATDSTIPADQLQSSNDHPQEEDIDLEQGVEEQPTAIQQQDQAQETEDTNEPSEQSKEPEQPLDKSQQEDEEKDNTDNTDSHSFGRRSSAADEQTDSATSMASGEAPKEDDVVLSDDLLVRGATLEKLIERLIGANKYADKEGAKFKKVFLLTYYSFTTPIELMTKIIEIYPTCNDKCQLNVLNFLSEWVKTGFHDFDNIVIAKMIHFLSSLGVERHTTKSKLKKIVLKQLLESKTSVSLYQSNKDNDNAPRVPNDFSLDAYKEPKIDLKIWRSLRKRTLPNPFDYAFDILEWPSIEIARQLTLIESELFKKIEPKECFGLGWSKANKEDLSPNIVAITERFNKMSFWIRNLFVNERDLKRRQAMWLKFLDIIKELRELRNYTSIFQITSALNSAEVHRLKQTREVMTDKQEEMFREAAVIFENNYSGLRSELKYAAGSPTVPFQGVYLTDLTFIEDGNQNFINYQDKELINFTKRRYYSTTISDIQLLQQASIYEVQPLPYLQYILTEDIFTNLEEDEKVLYKKSLQREARGK